jgi:hypothetical protein
MSGNQKRGKSSRVRRILLGFAITLAAVYLCFGAFVWWAMHQPPEVFGKVMARVPGPVAFVLYPFETLWTHARAGALKIGDPAPDFSLSTVNKAGPIQLSALNKQQPVVLIFGSYT